MKRRFLLFSILLIGALVACKQEKTYRFAEGNVFGTTYHISYDHPEDLQQVMRGRMDLVNGSLSMFNPRSVIARINSGESDTTDALFCRMYAAARAVNEQTGGAFDITVAPLSNVWGFGFRKDSFPDDRTVDSLRQMVGMEKITLEGGRIVKQVAGMQFDASAIAKGLGVDLVADCLDSLEIQNYMVEIGGEVRVKGVNAKGRSWRIGIDKPVDDATARDREIALIAELSSGALATSGNYRNYYMRDGRKYAHTIDPRTGFPVQMDILSSSVYAPECMIADAYATAFMVTGLEKAKEIVQSVTGLEACFIYTDSDGQQKRWLSPGFQKMVAEK